MSLTDFNHPQRQASAGELHSRPFIGIEAPATVSYFAAMHQPGGAPTRPNQMMIDFCHEIGLTPPEGTVSHFVHETDDLVFKWERHTEFSAFLFVHRREEQDHFADQTMTMIPQNWLEKWQVQILSSAVIALEAHEAKVSRAMIENFRQFFVPDSFAVSAVLDNAAYIMTDFHPDGAGHIRLVVLPTAGTGSKRLGRIVQRLIEIETYKTATMLALPAARAVSQELPMLGRELPPLLARMHEGGDGVIAAFSELLAISSRTETLLADTDYRFSAAEAYSNLVDQRITVLREKRVDGFQMVSEFLNRRFNPSVRTIFSSRQQLQNFSARVERAANLLRTQIDVNNANAQQELLQSMNRRGEVQLRLQETVEGFSVVAISYYAISLLGYLGAPIAKALHIDKSVLLALAVPPTVLMVWFFINRIKKRVAGHESKIGR